MAQKINQKQYGKKYSTTEQLTGDVWIDGKPIYRKVVATGPWPNATFKDVPHGVSGMGDVISIGGYAGDGTTVRPVNWVDPSSLASSIAALVTGANVRIYSGTNRTGITGYITLEYTKT